jgi:hypothetical protein
MREGRGVKGTGGPCGGGNGSRAPAHAPAHPLAPPPRPPVAQGEPEFDRLKRELEEVKHAHRGLEGTYRSVSEMERHRAKMADEAIEEQLEVQTAFREQGARLQAIYDKKQRTEYDMAKRWGRAGGVRAEGGGGERARRARAEGECADEGRKGWAGTGRARVPL